LRNITRRRLQHSQLAFYSKVHSISGRATVYQESDGKLILGFRFRRSVTAHMSS
jgi:hypothetical protein